MAKNIMIIEDNREILTALSKIAKTVCPNAEIFSFLSLKGAYEAALTRTIDLFLIDIILETEMPGDTSGIQFVKAMRELDKYKFTPVIFVTSVEDCELHAYSKLHSYGYIEKPFDVDEVKEIIEEALKFSEPKGKDKILYMTKGPILFALRSSEIVYAEMIEREIHFHKVDNTVLVIPYKTLKQVLEEADDKNLKQCGKKIIYNERYVEYKDRANHYIKLKGVEKLIEVGKTYWKYV